MDLEKKSNRSKQYELLISQVKALLTSEHDLIANMANFCAIIKTSFNFFWVGFYLVKNNELVLGPFQGPVACTRIKLGKGVCGTAWLQKQTKIVKDVTKFPGHIACNTASKSEIVTPIIKNNQVIAVLDIDSDKLNDFSKIDSFYLEEMVTILNASFK